MSGYSVVYFEDDDKKSPLIKWFDDQKDRKVVAIVKMRINRLRLGLFGDSKYLTDGVFELRIHYGAGYRIYYTIIDEKMVVLLCAGDKKTQSKDIKMAIRYVALLKESRYA